MRYDDARAANEVKSVFRKRTSARRRASMIGDTAGASPKRKEGSLRLPDAPARNLFSGNQGKTAKDSLCGSPFLRSNASPVP